MGLFLNLALVHYGLEYLYGKGFTPNQPPFLMLREAMAKTAQLEQFDEEASKSCAAVLLAIFTLTSIMFQLYKVTDDGTEKTDKYLVPHSYRVPEAGTGRLTLP